MSNMGLEIALRKAGIRMLRANVGDKYVLEEMQKSGAMLGGEQSGHIIFRDGEATTGDGLLTALRVMEIMARTGKPLAELVGDLKVFPQTIQKSGCGRRRHSTRCRKFSRRLRRPSELDGDGRVVVRYSGTEALARVMVEAESEDKMRSLRTACRGSIRSALGFNVTSLLSSRRPGNCSCCWRVIVTLAGFSTDLSFGGWFEPEELPAPRP